MLCTTAALDDMLQVPALQVVLNTLARRHMRRRDLVDVKKLQANDNDSTVRDQND